MSSIWQCWENMHGGWLVAKIYKVKYYPQVSFLGAKLVGSPLFIWRSI